MLQALCPASFRRYTSFKVLGPTIDGFVSWLAQHRYSHSYMKQRVWLLFHIESTLLQRGVRRPSDIDQADLAACRKDLQQRFPYLTGTTDALEKYLREKGVIKQSTETASAAERYLQARPGAGQGSSTLYGRSAAHTDPTQEQWRKINHILSRAESKFCTPNGSTCTSKTVGLLVRRHIVAGEFHSIGKEASTRWGSGPDLSMMAEAGVLDPVDETFRVYERVVDPEISRRNPSRSKTIFHQPSFSEVQSCQMRDKTF